MNINHYILIKMQDENIGLFLKNMEMPCLPSIGSLITFGQGLWTVTCTVESTSFREDEGVFSTHYVIDVDERRNKLKEYISADHYPQILVNSCGFKTCWLEEAYANMTEKLKPANLK